MSFDLPEIVADDSQALCGIAIADLMPQIIRVAAGAQDLDGTSLCRGCRAGRAFAEFSVKPNDAAIDQEKRATIMPLLKPVRIFKGLSERDYEKILPLTTIHDFPQGTILLKYGLKHQPLYIICDGEVDVLKPNEEGELSLIVTLGAGECLGEMSLLTRQPASAAVRCRSQVRALRITEQDFDSLLARLRSLSSNFNHLLAERLRDTSSKLIEDLATDHHISGDLSMLSCAEIIQAISSTHRTGLLVLKSDKKLEIFFQAGRIIRLETPIEPPEEAFFEALAWKQGSFSFEVKSPEDVEQNVFVDTTGLLLEAMRRLDETPFG